MSSSKPPPPPEKLPEISRFFIVVAKYRMQKEGPGIFEIHYEPFFKGMGIYQKGDKPHVYYQ